LNAIRTLKQVLDEERYATPEEQAVMAKFVGWGGLPNVFKDESELSGMWLGAHRELKWLFDSRPEWGMSAWNDAMASTRNAHYTSEKVVRMMWDAVRHFGFEGGIALEPTVGVGNFISLQPKDLASATEWHATELDVVTGQLATMLFPNAHVIGGIGFEYAKFRNGVFDIAIGNPPFARDAVRTHAKGYEELKGLSLHNFIVGKSGKHLRPGGVMAMVITHHFLDAGDTRGRAQLAKDFKFLGAVRLPNTAFKANAGTEVTTDIIFLQKLHEGESPDMKAAWLDSSGKVTNKAGEDVSVNRYFEEHPNHILGEPSMRGKMHAGEEHTVEDDGRDFVKAFGDILAGDFAELKGTLKPSKRDLDVSAVMAMQSDIPVGGMRLEPDGKIRMRTDDDVSGNSVIVDIVPGIPWGNNAEEWHGMARIARELKEGVSASDLPVKMKEFFAFAKEAGIYNKNDAFAAKTDVGKGIDRLYKAGTEAAGKGSSLEWEFDDILKKIETGRKTRTLSQNNYERLNGLLDLRNRMLALNLAELRDAANMEEIRSGLREAYNNFVETFGHVSSKANRAMIGEDVGAEAGIEIEYDAGVTESQSQKTGAPVREASAVVADILDRRVVHPYREIVSVDGADPALHASIRERGKVDLEYMSDISGKDRDELIAELASGEAPKIFLNPANNKYEDASEYLSGNVKKKLAEAEKHRLETNAKALRKVQPAPKTAAQVTPSLKGSWIPAGVFERFLSDLGLQNVNVYVSSATGKIVGMASDVVLKTEWGGMFNNPDFSILDFFNAATQGKMLKAYVGSGDNRTIDREATDRANMLVEMMSREFEKWARGDAGIMDKIVDAFNEKMNTHVEPKFNGRELLVTAGANPSVEMRDTQKDAAWRMIRTDSVLLDHVVGAGKTYALITGAMERRRMGASKKPLFVVPNHLVGQWTRDFYKLYPGSRVLAASEKSMKPQNRKALFARIATGDFDAVIIGHSHLSFIENAAVDEKAIIDEQLSGLRAALEDAEETGNSRSVKQIQERIDKYKARLAELAEGKRDEIGYDFEKMGIDYLVVDEAHLFKNLEYSSGNPRIAGMNDPKGTAKSFDMYVKTRGLRKRGGGVAFATGTPVSNSLVEIYTMMKYLAYDELASKNLQHFDAWAGAYTITETRLEYTATQKLKPRRVLSSLVNLSSLQQIYKQFADTITLQNLKDAYRIQMERENESLPEGKKKRTEFPVPKIVENPDSGRNERRLDTGEPSEEQTEYFDYLTARMNAIESNARNSKYRRIDNPLWVLNDARIASLDIRTIDPTLPRNGNGKVMRAARNIKRLYDQWDDVRGAQLVFCDDSVPSSGSKAKAKKMFKTFAEGVFGEGDAARIMKRLEGRPFIEQWKGLQSALENLLDSEDSRVKAAEDFLEKNEEKYADFRMTALARTADSGFSVYEDLRKVLSQEMGIPESEIQFIHDHDTTEKKAELFARVNSGNVRILIGSTDMMGAGMNAQERLVALHHLDAPWRPSDLEQREGRIIRQKNELYLADPDGFRIEIIAYSTEKTSDAVMWQTLERKARGIEQFRSGDGVDTLTEEGGNDADQFANFMANTTGNPVFLQKLKAERRYNELEASQSGLIRSKSSAERFMDSFDTEKEKLELAIKNAESASASVIKYGEHKGSGKEIDAVLDAATKAYWAEKEEYDAEYRVYSEEWNRWRSAGADKNTEPKAPTSPVMPWLLSKSVVADSDGAKAIAKAFEDAKKLSSGDHVSIPVGNVEVRIVNYGAGSLSDKKRAEGLKEWGVAFHRNPKGKPDWRIVQTGVEARNLSDLVESVHPKFIERVYANLLVSAKKDLDRMIANRPAMEKMAAMDIDQSEANRALQELAWYQRQVSFAELDADIERADRKNRFIEADTFRRLSVKKRDSYGEDRTGDVVKDIDGEEYRLDGHNLGIYTRAFRMKDDVPVVLVSESKDGKTRYVVELEQPASLREGAEETLYQMGDADAAQQMTPEESLKLVQAIRAGDLRSRHLGKVWEGEPPTGPLVRTVIPISEIPDVTIEYMRETSDPERVNRYAKDDIQTPIYLRVNQEGYLVVSDGGHRLLAAIQRGDSTINVLMPANYVRDGDRYVLKSEADLSSDADYLAAVEAGDMETAQRMVDERLAASGAYWHGTPSGDLRGGRSGLHVGTKQAATEALEARIGIPADGKGWDGTREYGKTLLAGRDRVRSGEFGKYRDTGYNAKSPAEDHYPTEMPTVGKGVPVDPTWKPWVRPVLVVSDMSNTPRSPMSDAKANATMAGMLKRGSARRGYFYTNDGEDAGSVSAVLPNGDSVRVKLADPVTYDDSGKIIPLSKRFDSGNEDVRYQRRLTPKSGSYRDNLKKDAAAFAVAVDDTVSGKGEPDSYVNVMTTPLVLSLVGADVLPVQMRRQKLLDVMSKHGLSSEVLKKIPAALADPIMVFKSDLKAKGESLVVMLDLTDDDGATIIAALHLDVVPGRNMYAINRLASVYGKKDAVENRDAWFVEQMEKGNAKYINKKKSSQWFGRASFFFTGGANLESFITQSVATEADLVKLRNAYPGYYQGEGAEAKGSITFRRGTDARPEIRLFENADASTFMHEAMHFFVDDLLRQMNTGKASDETKNLFRQLNNVVRVSKDKNKKFILAEKEHEKLAVGFEAYLERGVAPKGAKGLQGVFEKFKQWLKELFSFARSNNVEMSDALVSLYDTMLTTPEERAAAESELAESANVEESVETIEAAEVEADVNEGVETVEAGVVEEEELLNFASTEGEKELAGQPRAWEAPRPSMNPEARALGLRKIRDLVKRLVPWRFGNTEDRTGVYSEREKLIKTKDDYDFPTAMHEVGHHLMTELKLNTGLQKGTLKELEALGKQTARPGAAQDVVLAEGVAQFVQYYIINKAAAKASAPIFFVEFESRLDKADAKLVEDFGDLRDAVSAFYESSPESRVLAHVRSAGEKRPYSKTLVSSRLKRAIFKSYEGLVDDKHSWNLLTEWIKDTPEGKKEMANNGGFLPDKLDFYAQVSTLAGYMKQADKDVEGMMALVGKLTKKEYDQLTAYAVSLQSIEYYDNDMNPGTGPRSDHEAVVANTPQHIKDVLKGVQDIYNNMVKETLLDTGVISQEGFDAMRTKWENYVPFMRDLDEDGFIDWLTKGAPKNGANLRSYVDVRNPFMKRYGVAEHERTEIFDPFEVMIHNAVVFHGIKSRNDFAKLVVDAANSLKGFGWLASKSEAMSKADMKEHAVFYVWRDGQKEYYSTDPELYVLLKGMYDSGSKAGNPFIRGALSWMQFAADVFKMGTTRYNPAFMLLNFLRDAQGTAIQSEGWAMPFVATIKGLMLQLSNDPAHKKLIEDAIDDGVFYSAITSLPKGTSIEAIAKELRRQRRLASSTGIARTLRNLMETPRSVGGWIGRANEMIEMAPKLYEYEYLRRTKPKMGGKRAAMKARSVNIDFGRAGTWGRGFNSVTAFFNAGVQGLDKVREVSKQRPMQTFAKVMLYQVLPSVLMRLAILSNPDDEEKYQRIAPGMRDTHFFIPVQNETLGMNVWTRLPKADNWWIISAVFERMITEAAKKDPEAWRGFANSVVNLLPPYVPTMIAPIIQVWRNTDSFTDSPIVSKRFEHLPDELQFHTGTSETAKMLGKVTKTSPIMLEFMYDKHVGEVGAQVLSLAEWTFDMIGTGMGLVDEKTKMEAGKASDLPFFKRFFYDTTRAGEPLNRFYSYHDQLLDDKKRADAAGTAFEDERLLKAFNRTRAKFTEINREKDDIRLDPDLSRKDKRELIDMLENRAAEYAKAAMAVYYERKGIE